MLIILGVLARLLRTY